MLTWQAPPYPDHATRASFCSHVYLDTPPPPSPKAAFINMCHVVLPSVYYHHFLSLYLIYFLFPGPDPTSLEKDAAVLLAFKKRITNFDAVAAVFGWKGWAQATIDDACFWSGVTCDSTGQKVVGLSLFDKAAKTTGATPQAFLTGKEGELQAQ